MSFLTPAVKDEFDLSNVMQSVLSSVVFAGIIVCLNINIFVDVVTLTKCQNSPTISLTTFCRNCNWNCCMWKS
jgi:hypothetical protein